MARRLSARCRTFFGSLRHARRIDEHVLAAGQRQDAVQQVPRGLRLGRDDRELLADQPVEEARLAGVRPADQADGAAAVLAQCPSLSSMRCAACLLRALQRSAGPGAAQAEVREHAFHVERAPVRLAARREGAVLGELLALLVHDLLQLGLRVLGEVLGVERLELRAEHRRHCLARRVVAAVEKHRAEHRLDRVREQRGLHLDVAEAQVLRQADPLARLGKRFLAHQAGAQPRQLAFRELREAGVELVGDRAAEHAVAEEFQPLVVVERRGCGASAPARGAAGR